ncbi:MAG: hypothetical protein H0U96_03350 [Acidobacteria bacterium]|nr:hypothetical protein [Acidobacteriota bacterium]
MKRDFSGHEVFTIDEAGFKGLKNGNLIFAASESFEILITVDKNIRHQQNTNKLPIAIIVLSAKSNHYESLSPLVLETLRVLENIRVGEIIIILEKQNRG